MSAPSLHSEQVTDLRIGVRCGETSAYRAASGQTLIELASVFAFLGSLAAIGVGFIVVATSSHCPTYAQTVRSNDLPAVLSGLKTYRLQTDRYPSESEGLQALVSAGIVDKAPRDPWQNPYRYSLDGNQPVVTSMGADGLPGTEDDVSSNDLALRASR
jgi:general secretion pathway protein G